jgi:hypothetical protein
VFKKPSPDTGFWTLIKSTTTALGYFGQCNQLSVSSHRIQRTSLFEHKLKTFDYKCGCSKKDGNPNRENGAISAQIQR